MVFSSPEFIFLFLPFVVLLFHALNRLCAHRAAVVHVFLCSLFFYGYWKFANLHVLVCSILFNYLAGNVLYGATRGRKFLFITAVGCNLCSLGYYKYTNFFIESCNAALGWQLACLDIALPIGISFFTFQQIAYLADIYTGRFNPTGQGFLGYSLFVSFFPQLVAGPIVHHREMIPQFESLRHKAADWQDIYHGLLFFSMGLAKKVLMADNLSPVVALAFDQTASLTVGEAALGSLAYTLQLYFDFSGYSDMAVGCGRLMGIKLPWNFDSPYKSKDLQEFWRRWHITLSRWLRDYLYIPLGGSRRGRGRTLANLCLTFLLGGLWHGAAWTFVLWGALHGAGLAVHRLWHASGRALPGWLGWLVTFAFVNAGWVLFRAGDFACVHKFAVALSGANGLGVSPSFAKALFATSIFNDLPTVTVTVGLFALLAIAGKNSQQVILAPHGRLLPLCCMVLLAVALIFVLLPGQTQEFIYFQF